VDRSGGLAEPDAALFGIAGVEGLAVTRPIDRDCGFERVLATVPVVGEGVADVRGENRAATGDSKVRERSVEVGCQRPWRRVLGQPASIVYKEF
jgi:hypothetical protein